MSHDYGHVSIKFGTINVSSGNQVLPSSPPNLMQSSFNVAKAKRAREVGKCTAKEVEQTSEVPKKKYLMERTSRKFDRFLARQDGEIALIVKNLLPSQVQGATINFWNDKW